MIAGEARGVPLQAPRGRATRPTSDLVKGAIFSALGDLGCEGRVLDLFAGSGALGIEALSRGADWCDFVDDSPAACRAIEANLAKTRLADRARVYGQPAMRFIAAGSASSVGEARSAGSKQPYDLILLDPPYAYAGLEELLETLGMSPLVGPGTAVLLEHASRRPAPAEIGQLAQVRSRTHGDTAFTLYRAVRGAGSLVLPMSS